ncbi:hypothetical protein J6590_037022 [Homalodisca vitripennis]|nr:hypothetical protein J6590_037022 [Homalodisca vitripennis]
MPALEVSDMYLPLMDINRVAQIVGLSLAPRTNRLDIVLHTVLSVLFLEQSSNDVLRNDREAADGSQVIAGKADLGPVLPGNLVSGK